jgi:hypothetical protein
MKKELKDILKNSNDKNQKYEAGIKLMDLFLQKGDLFKFEYYGNLTIKIDPIRPETILYLMRTFRERGEYYKAMHYYQMRENVIFNDNQKIFNILFDYEYSIFIYYIDSDRTKGLKRSIEYLNTEDRPYFENIFNNLEYYVQPISKIHESFEYNFKKFSVIIKDKEIVFNPSSPSLAYVDVNGEKKLIMNVRYKHYNISPQGVYYSDEIDEGRFIVRTENFYCFLDEDFKSTTTLQIMPDILDDLPLNKVDIKGLEDLRIFTFKDKLYHLSTSREYSSESDISKGLTNTYRMILGEYNWKDQKFIGNRVINSPYNIQTEKNWLPIVQKDSDEEKLFFIYSYHPLKIGRLNFTTNDLEIVKEIPTPDIFSRFRGSAVSCVTYQDRYYILVHLVKHSNPRKYYHSLIVLDENLLPIRYTLPFYFIKNSIEYSLGMKVSDGHVSFIISQWDDKPTLIQSKLSDFHWIQI